MRRANWYPRAGGSLAMARWTELSKPGLIPENSLTAIGQMAYGLSPGGLMLRAEPAGRDITGAPPASKHTQYPPNAAHPSMMLPVSQPR